MPSRILHINELKIYSSFDKADKPPFTHTHTHTLSPITVSRCPSNSFLAEITTGTSRPVNTLRAVTSVRLSAHTEVKGQSTNTDLIPKADLRSH